jgi:Fic family protein
MIKQLTTLANPEHLETRAVLKQLVTAHRYLAELKGIAATIPNPEILINALSLQEAKDSSEIENIFTTQDELFQADIFSDSSRNAAAKEVRRYAAALRFGFERMRGDRLITVNRIVDFHQVLMGSDAGIRKLPGTVIKNLTTGEVVFTPPQDPSEIQALLTDLERFMNDDTVCAADPLVVMAIAHHQFESIHPFYDGNGRVMNDDTVCAADPLVVMAIAHHQFESIHPFYDGNGRAGRILNSLYLVAKGLLDQPVLYLSGYVIDTKADYYSLLQSTRETNDWEPWLLYLIRGVEETSKLTIGLIEAIRKLMNSYEERIKKDLPKIHSHELLNNLFRHPYTKIEAVQEDLGVSRLTASKYLSALTEKGFVEKHRSGKYNYYVNRPLIRIFE